MAKYLHLASREDIPPTIVEARRFEHYGRWTPPNAEKTTTLGVTNEATVAVFRGDWEVDTGQSWGDRQFLVPGLIFSTLYAPHEEQST